MTNALPANAAPMPAISRRSALGSIAGAAALLAAPLVAKASQYDSDVYAAIEHVMALHRDQEAIGDAKSALNEQLPERASFPALIVRQEDHTIFKVQAAVGEAMGFHEVDAARRAGRGFKALGYDESHPLFGAACARVAEIERAGDEFSRLWKDAIDHLDYRAAEDAFGEAVSQKDEAAQALLDVRPRTIAGLRAVLVALIDVRDFLESYEAEPIVQFLLEAPALGGEV